MEGTAQNVKKRDFLEKRREVTGSSAVCAPEALGRNWPSQLFSSVGLRVSDQWQSANQSEDTTLGRNALGTVQVKCQ